MGSDNNVVIVFLNKMTDMFLLNILFIIGCLPIFTVGASLSAMYAVNLRSVRYGDGYVVKTFLAFYKKCFKQATVAWIVFVILGLLLFFDYRFWSTVDFGGVIEKPMMILSLVIAFAVLMIFEWLFPVIAKLDDSLMVQLKNSAKMAIGYFVPYTVLCIGITALVSYLLYTNAAMAVVMIMVGFSVITYVKSFFFYRVFAKYIDEAPASENDLLYPSDGKVFDEVNGDE